MEDQKFKANLGYMRLNPKEKRGGAKKLGRVFWRLKIIKSRLAWAIVINPGSMAHRVHGEPGARGLTLDHSLSDIPC